MCVCAVEMIVVVGGVVGWGDTHVLIIGPGYAKLFARWWVAVCLPRRLLP